MRTITLTAITLVLAASPHAAPQVAKELQPSLAILQTVSKGMPDPRGVPFYTAIPDRSGDLRSGVGNSDRVRGWFRQMEPMLASFANVDEKLRTDVDVYGDTVREEGDTVLASAGNNLKSSLSALDRATSGKVLELLLLYNDEVRATRLARKEFDAATKRAEEAGYLVEASDAAATECNALLERSKLQAEKSAALARIEEDTAFLNAVDKAISAMQGGVAGVTAYLTDNLRSAAKTLIVEAFHSGTRETLVEIEAKLEAIDKALADVKCKSQAAALKAAKTNLEARMIGVLIPYGKILDHRAKAWGVVDRLGTLQDPKTGRALPFFRNLQAYNAQVNTMGRTVFDAVNGYLDFLAKEPISRGPLILKFVNEDIALVEGERRPAEKWSEVASQTKLYLDRYASWYRGEIKRGQTVLADLREGRHLDFVDRMLARATKELGATVSYEDIIR